MAACRLIIADDHPLFRDALRLTVVQTLPQAEVVEAASFGELRAALAGGAETDLVLLDLDMPGMQGLSGLLLIRAEFAAVPVAIISANEEPATVRRALDLGAAGYIPKSSAPGEIRRAIAALLAGEAWLPPALDQRMAAEESDDLALRLSSLTPQQARVLMMLSQGLLNKQIAHALEVSEATVKAHVSGILQKLGVDTRTQAVLLAQRLAGTHASPDLPARVGTARR